MRVATNTLPLVLLVLSVPLLSAAVREDKVVLSGTVEDCFMRSQYAVAGEEVSAFATSASRELIEALTTMKSRERHSSASGELTALDRDSWRVMALLDSAPALARDTTDNTGAFTLSVPKQDSVLIVGHAHREDMPFRFVHVRVAARADTSLTIDMADGACVPRSPRSARLKERMRA